MKGKTILIIGTDSEIVFDVALELSKQDARVICTCHDKTKAEIRRKNITDKTGNKRIVTRFVDLTSLDSVREFAASVNKHLKRLDVLINLADCFGLPHLSTDDGLQISMQVNYFSPFLLINLLLDLLENSGASRVILSTSKLARYGKIDIGNLNRSNRSLTVYIRAKFCMALFAKELPKKLIETEVNVSCVDLDFVDTDCCRNLPLIIRKLLNISTKSKAADLIVNAVKTDLPGRSEFESEPLRKRILTFDHLMSDLWNISEKLVDLAPFSTRTSRVE